MIQHQMGKDRVAPTLMHHEYDCVADSILSGEVWADTAWDSLEEARNRFPEETYREVDIK